MRRRTMLSGLAALGSGVAVPALGQAIRPQRDPWAQVDPYADEQPDQGRGGEMLRREPLFTGRLSPEDEEEIALGRAAYPYRIKKDGGAYPDKRLQQAMADFCRPIFAHADRRHLPWVVTLVDSPFPDINATAGAGGTVIVFSGIIQVFDDPLELAGVLAHEAAHVDLQHSFRGRELSMLLQRARAAGMVPMDNQTLGDLIPETRGAVEDILQLMDITYTRDDEADADAHAVTILHRMGADPMGLANGFKAIKKLEAPGRRGSEWLQSHPFTEDRIRDGERKARLLPRPRTPYVFPGWDQLKAAFPTIPALRKG